MKKQIILLLIIGICHNTNAQTNNCYTGKGISTNPANPINPEMDLLFSNKINPWLNSFNIGLNNGASFSPIPLNKNAVWNIPGWSPTQTQDYQMVNPFSFNMPGEYSYLQQPTNPIGMRDFNWQDGWELLWMNTGYYPNQSTTNHNGNINIYDVNRIYPYVSNPAHSRYPYIILYNKYRGTMRMFGKVLEDQGSFQNVQLVLKFPSPPPGVTQTQATGIFRHLNGFDLPLDKPTEITNYSAANKNDNNSTIWTSSDVQLGYDPCICNHKSELEMRFVTFDTWDVNLYGHSIGTVLPLQDANGNPIYGDFLSQSAVNENALSSNAPSGSLIYKNLNSMIENYRVQLDYYNTRTKDLNTLDNTLKRELLGIVKTIGIDGMANFIAPTGALKDFIFKNAIQLNPNTKLPKDASEAEDWAKAINNAAKGVLGSGFDLLSAQFLGSLTPPVRPNMPTATFEEMRIAGTLTKKSDFYVTKFSSQGVQPPSIGDLTAHNYPAYNETPGIFALLRTPTVEMYFNQNPTRSNRNTYTDSYGGLNSAYWEETQQTSAFLKIKNPLQFKLNRALDIDDSKTRIRVSFELEYETNMNQNPANFVTKYETSFNLEGNFHINNISPNSNSIGERVSILSEWYDIKDESNILFGYKSTNLFRYAATKPYNGVFDATIGAPEPNILISMVQNLFTLTPNLNYTLKKVRMKILSDVYFNRIGVDGKQINTTQAFTYNLFDVDKSINLILINYNVNSLLKHNSGTLLLGTTVFGPNSNNITKVVGNNIYVVADKIVIKGDISVQNGYSLYLQAFGDISNENSSNIFKNVTQELIEIGHNDIYGQSQSLELTSEQVAAFCNDQTNGYKANFSFSKTSSSNPEQELLTTKEPTFNINLYPNPSTDFTQLYYSLEKNSTVTISVFDLSGNQIINVIDNKAQEVGEHIEYINTQSLSAGIYFIRLITAEGYGETRKLLIAK